MDALAAGSDVGGDGETAGALALFLLGLRDVVELHQDMAVRADIVVGSAVELWLERIDSDEDSFEPVLAEQERVRVIESFDPFFDREEGT